MGKHFISLFSILFCCSFLLLSQIPPSGKSIQNLIEREVNSGRSPSIVVGIIDHGKEFYYCYGNPYAEKEGIADENTIYAIASITKTFTTTIFTEMVLRKKFVLNDKVIDHLPDSLQFKDERMHEITLLDLACHTSGFPNRIRKYDLREQGAYFASYSENNFLSDLEGFRLSNDPGESFHYTNLNIALLSYVMQSETGKDLETLYQEYITIPLGLKNTTLNLSESQKNNFADPHYRVGRAGDNFTWSSQAAAGGLRSTANDLIQYLRLLFWDESYLNEAADLAIQVRFDSTHIRNTQMGLGWYITPGENTLYVGHGGTTFGTKSLMMYDVKNDRGVVVLSNCEPDIIDIGLYALNKENMPGKYKAIRGKTLDAEGFSPYAGKYLIYVQGNEEIIEMYERGGLFFINSKVAGEFELFFQGKHRFFLEGIREEIKMKDFKDGKACTIENPMFSGKRVE